MLGPTGGSGSVHLSSDFLLCCACQFAFVAMKTAIGINLGHNCCNDAFLRCYLSSWPLPLLLTVAILFKRTQSGLAVSYYVLISVPLMIMQYFQHILTIARVDFWNDPSASSVNLHFFVFSFQSHSDRRCSSSECLMYLRLWERSFGTSLNLLDHGSYSLVRLLTNILTLSQAWLCL